MIISKRELPKKNADSEYMTNLLKQMEGVDDSPIVNPQADVEEMSDDTIPSNELMGQKRMMKSRYSALGEEYVNDEILNMLAPENINSYISLLELVSATKQAIKYYTKEIERMDLEAATSERGGDAESSSQLKQKANQMSQKLSNAQDTMSKIPGMIAKWKQANLKV